MKRKITLFTAGGIGASVAAGALAGALLFAPSISGAQEGGSTETSETTQIEKPAVAPLWGAHPDWAGERCHKGHGGGPGGPVGVRAAAVIGIEASELRQALRSGSTVAEVAIANDVTVDELVDGLLAERFERLDGAVADGRITEEQAAEHKQRLREKVTARVNGERPAGLDRL